ncbi:MAG: MASE1 domain-containing protein, partial [Microcystaceae cyanobacterium]
AILTPLLSACFGTLCLGLTGLLRPDQVLLVFITWWLANALANLVFSPVFILVRFEKWSLLKTKKVELGIVLFFLILVNILTFVSNYPVAYLYLPLILITVCHLGGFVANVVVSLATLIALFFTAQGHGVFLQIFQIQPLIFLQSFTGILSLTALLFAALTQELEQARKALTQMIDSLENQVKCRTCELQVAQQKLQFANQELEKLVNLDALTQVANRRWFDRTLEQEWYRLLREQKPLSLLMLDIDYFKAYNVLSNQRRLATW